MSIHTLPSAADCARAIDLVPDTVPDWIQHPEGPTSFLTIAPGMVRLWSRDLNKWERRLERAAQARKREVDLLLALGEVCDTEGMSTRGRITGWSAKSRLSMQRKFASVDWTELFDGSRQAAMVTLTMPHNWVPLAPTAGEFKKIVDRWMGNYRVAWGERCRGGWKMEFQLRQACLDGSCNLETAPAAGEPHDPRAPHLHILTTIPEGPPAFATVSPVSGMVADDFKSWLSISWPKACGSYDKLPPQVALTHEQAGTAVDVDETIRYGDPLRMSLYFSKHGLFEAKDYQNDMPEVWAAGEEGGARFWGVWGMTDAAAHTVVDVRIADQLARALRRKSRADGKTITRKVWRSKELPDDMQAELEEDLRRFGEDSDHLVDITQRIGRLAASDGRWRRVWVDKRGRLRIWKKRSVRRRNVRMQNSRGFQLVNDGPAMGMMLARLVTYYAEEAGLLDDVGFDVAEEVALIA